MGHVSHSSFARSDLKKEIFSIFSSGPLEVFGMPRYSKCCCFSAETGTLILGFLGLISGVIGLITYSFLLSDMDKIDEFFVANIRQLPPGEPGAERAKQALELMQMMISHAFAIGVVDSIIELLVCGSLIYGVNDGKPFWMLPWLILRGIALVFLTIGAFAIFVTVACVDVGQGFLSLVFLIPMVTLFYLCWFVVQSVYLDTKEGKINGTNTFRV